MKYLIEKIEEAAEKAGGKAELAKNLEISRTVISDVLGSRRGLPLDACYKLADMTGANLARIVAENEAITAKKEKAEFWKKKLMEFEKLAACILVGVILNMSPTPSQAAQSLQAIDLTLYIMSNKANAAQASENLMGTYPLALPIQKICHRPLQTLLPTLLTKS